MLREKRWTGELEGAAARLELDKQPSKTSDLSDFLTSTARFFVKCNFTKNMAFLQCVKKVLTDFLTRCKAPENFVLRCFFQFVNTLLDIWCIM